MFEQIQDVVNKLVDDNRRKLDEAYLKMLQQNGFEIDELTEDNLKRVKIELDKQGLYLDYIYFNIFITKEVNVITIVYPFLNDINNPVSQEVKNKWLKDYCKKEGFEITDDDIKEGHAVK